MDQIVQELKAKYRSGQKLTWADFGRAASRFCQLYPVSAREMGGYHKVATLISRKVRQKGA